MKTLKEIDPLEARYIAGFFDGEGSIGIYKARRLTRTQTLYLSLAISNSDLAVLEHIKDHCGGCIIAAKFRTNTQIWHWHAYSREAAHILRALFPFLRVKQAQAVIALQFTDLVALTAHRSRPIGMPRIHADELALRDLLAARLSTLKRPWRVSHLESTT